MSPTAAVILMAARQQGDGSPECVATVAAAIIEQIMPGHSSGYARLSPDAPNTQTRKPVEVGL